MPKRQSKKTLLIKENKEVNEKTKMVKVDKEKCIGCGACASVCSESFVMKDGKAEFTGKKADCTKEAIETCPVDAISG